MPLEIAVQEQIKTKSKKKTTVTVDRSPGRTTDYGTRFKTKTWFGKTGPALQIELTKPKPHFPNHGLTGMLERREFCRGRHI